MPKGGVLKIMIACLRVVLKVGVDHFTRKRKTGRREEFQDQSLRSFETFLY